MLNEEGWLVNEEIKELIEIFSIENHEILPQMLNYAFNLLEHEFGDTAQIHFCVNHDPGDGTRTIDINVRIDNYEESEQDPTTLEYLPHTFWGKIEKVRKSVDKKFPCDSYRRLKLSVEFLITTDFVLKTQHSNVELSTIPRDDLVNELVNREGVDEHPILRDEKFKSVMFTKETWDHARILVVKNL